MESVLRPADVGFMLLVTRQIAGNGALSRCR